ncbi:MAG: hypothetical protein LUG98_14165 [Tannerellaceae bacterium]|nr:hypothetical protein [Tannerellaceae bacterium]
MKDKKVVFLFFAHQITDTILKRYQCLQKAGSLYGDVYFVFHKQDDCIIPAGLNPYIFTYNTLNQLPFKAIRETIVPGSAHFPLLQFYRDFPVYDYYWIIEYDVVFNGDWSFF